ncbi:MAG: hypothetical protein ACRD16_15240 [Thermoanaerobaculia bacterium]
MLSRIGPFSVFLLWLSAPAVSPAAEPPPTVVAFNGYALEVPSGFCIQTRRGPDFVVRYLRSGGLTGPILAGAYTGFAPDFRPDCANPTKRSWTAKALSFESVRGADGCAEFLVRDPKKETRGVLHVWFGPDAKANRTLAEKMVDSIAPADKAAGDVEPLACK